AYVTASANAIRIQVAPTTSLGKRIRIAEVLEELAGDDQYYRANHQADESEGSRAAKQTEEHDETTDRGLAAEQQRPEPVVDAADADGTDDQHQQTACGVTRQQVARVAHQAFVLVRRERQAIAEHAS